MDCLTEKRIAEITTDEVPIADAERLHVHRCAECRAAIDAARDDESLLGETRSALRESFRDRMIDIDDEIPWQVDSIPGVHLERIVASGGQGVLFSAATNDGRRVAVKIPRRAATKSALRLELEAAIIGRLSHPNIVAIVDSGNSPIGPYVVTEWIDGRDLLAFAADDHPDAERIAAIFTAITDAVAHAHAAGIIHRDLTPANVLVDRSGKPHIIDFGIASAAGAAIEGLLRTTETGEFVGTLTFCAPEVWRTPEAVDERADVYSLGVMLKKVVATAIGAPTDRPGRVLFEIAQKAQSLEPAARYPSAAEMSRALSHVDGDDETPPPPKTARRRIVVAATIFGIVLSAGIGIFLRSSLRDRRKADERATTQRIGDLVRDAIDRESRSGMPPSVPLTSLLPEIEKEIGDDLDRMNGGFLFETIGKTYVAIGLIDDSIDYFRDAIERYRTCGEPARRDLARALHRLGRAQIDLRVDGSEATLREALEIRRSFGSSAAVETAESLGALGCAIATRYRDPDPMAGRTLVAEALAMFRSFPGRPAPGFAQTLRDLATIDGEKDADAEAALLREAVQKSEAAQPFDEHDRFLSLTALAAALPRIGRADKAAVVLQEAAESARRLNGPDRAEFILRSLARLHYTRGDFATSEAFTARALSAALWRREREFPGESERIRALAARLDGDPETLTSAISDGFRLLAEFVGPMSYETAQWMSGVAMLQKSMGRIDVAESLYRSALGFRCPHFGDDCPIRVGVMFGLAQILKEKKQRTEAKSLIDEVVKTVRRTGNADSSFGREAFALQKELESP